MDKNYQKKLAKSERNLFEILPGYACNANCRFCSLEAGRGNIASGTEDLVSSIYRAKKEGFKYLGIGGGEPTIRKDLPALIAFAKKLNFEAVRIETNGILLSYFDYCDDLAKAGLDFVKISIHGHKAEIHDHLTRVPGSFNKILQAIENLQRLGIRVEINTVINKKNYRFYPQFVRFFARKGVGSFCFIYPLYTGRMAENWNETGVSIKLAAPYINRSLKLIDDLELDKGLVFNIPFCCLEEQANKMVELSSFNTKVSSPSSVIESVDYERLKSKKKLERCEKCIYFQSCEGIWLDYLKIFGDGEFQPIYANPRKNIKK
jgi:cyclic pyranopterin phosphate synthase